LEAVRRFDPDRGVPFSAFALQHIRWQMLRFVGPLLNLSPSARRHVGAVLRAWRWLYQQLERSPTEAEIAHRLGIPRWIVEEILTRLGADILRPHPDLETPIARPSDADQLEEPEWGRHDVRLLALYLLRELGYRWKEISDLLSGPLRTPEGWDSIAECFPGLVRLYPLLKHWESVRELFYHLPLALTPEALRQFWSRSVRHARESRQV
jgi:hypothetical protein